RQMVRLFSEMLAAKEPIGTIEDRSLPGPAGPIAFRHYAPLGAGDALSGVSFISTAAPGFSAISIRTMGFAALSPMKAAVALWPSTTVSPRSTNSLQLSKTPVRRQNGLRLMPLNWESTQIDLRSRATLPVAIWLPLFVRWRGGRALRLLFKFCFARSRTS